MPFDGIDIRPRVRRNGVQTTCGRCGDPLTCENWPEINQRKKIYTCSVCLSFQSGIRYRKNYARSLYTGAKARAKKKGHEFSITVDDIIIPIRCPALGIVLEIAPFGRRTIGLNSPTIDRIDNTKGYIKGNVIVISNLANRIKTSATSAQILAVGRWLEALET